LYASNSVHSEKATTETAVLSSTSEVIVQQSILDCLDKGDPCEGPTCEDGEVCLTDDGDNGYCYPEFCKDFFKSVNPF
jgi:hypothetical protein